MSVRDWMNNNSTTTTIVAIALLVVALGVVALQLRGPGISQGSAYYWDLQADKAFVADQNQLPPVEAPSGGQGARAYLFSCGACNADEWFGYIENASDQLQQARKDGTLEAMIPPERMAYEAAHIIIRRLDGEQWVQRSSDVGEALQQQVRNTCETADQFVVCEP